MLQNLTLGGRREKGPTKRKMPVTADDMEKIYDFADWGNPDSVTLWCTASIAWFFTLRRGYMEIVPKSDEDGDVNLRHPCLTDDIEP